MNHASFRIRLGSVLLLVAFLAVLIERLPSAHEPDAIHPHEQWKANLAGIQTVDAAMPVVRTYIEAQTGAHDERIAKGIDQFVKDRFISGFSYIKPREDWLLTLFGAAFGSGYTVPVDPDDILKHRQAMCSQQSIVFMELLRRYHVRFGAVLFHWPDPMPGERGHFAVAAQIDGVWRYFDSDLETKGSPPVSTVIDGTALASLYGDKPRLEARMRYAAAHHGISLAHINTFSAPRGRALQMLTRVFSRLTPFIFLIAGLILWPGFGRLFGPKRKARLAARPSAQAALSGRKSAW